MSEDRYQQAQWLEWSGLPLALNGARQGAWSVFKKLIELDCHAGRRPGTVEISLEELGERVGIAPDKVEAIIATLRKKKYLRCFLPDSAQEVALFEIRVPVVTPVSPEEVAQRTTDPFLRDPAQYRYIAAEEAAAPDERKVQEVVDYYLNHLSQKVNGFVVEEIEIAARRFPLETIRLAIDRAARHEIRSMSWVLKQLFRDQKKKDSKPAAERKY